MTDETLWEVDVSATFVKSFRVFANDEDDAVNKVRDILTEYHWSEEDFGCEDILDANEVE